MIRSCSPFQSKGHAARASGAPWHSLGEGERCRANTDSMLKRLYTSHCFGLGQEALRLGKAAGAVAAASRSDEFELCKCSKYENGMVFERYPIQFNPIHTYLAYTYLPILTYRMNREANK